MLASIAPAAARTVRAEVPVHAQSLADYCSVLRAFEAPEGVTLGATVIDLRSGDRCDLLGDREFRSASLYKLPIMVEAYAQVAEGRVSFDDVLLILPEYWIDDPPEYRYPVAFPRTAGEALEAMITYSDNASAYALREWLGYANTDARPVRQGMFATVLRERFVTTPNDIALLFQQLYRGEVVSLKASAEMLALMRAQLIDGGFPAALPEGTLVAHKTGLLEDHLHDAGIIYSASGDFVLVTLTEFAGWDLTPAQATIHDFVRHVMTFYEHRTAPEPYVATPTPAQREAIAEREATDAAESTSGVSLASGAADGTGGAGGRLVAAVAPPDLATVEDDRPASGLDAMAAIVAPAEQWWLSALVSLVVGATVGAVAVLLGPRLARGGRRN